jgi:hypothetical protein
LINLKVPFYKNKIPKKEGNNKIAPVLIDRDRLKNNEESKV